MYEKGLPVAMNFGMTVQQILQQGAAGTPLAK